MSNAYNEGYNRGLKGEGSSGDLLTSIGDCAAANGSSKKREEGYKAGRRDRAFIDAQNKGKK
ncbi:MAG: hypothetical protein RID53_31375 [Coleofasciculus sp. B1-GNL1-01]|jgi:hypothetical protein|uniref:hypothetical protein n=1 Tax=Coleofasciculus sp. B1-GNL1-01 TaxID=3068484 RepID=UPI0032F9111B